MQTRTDSWTEQGEELSVLTGKHGQTRADSWTEQDEELSDLTGKHVQTRALLGRN